MEQTNAQRKSMEYTFLYYCTKIIKIQRYKKKEDSFNCQKELEEVRELKRRNLWDKYIENLNHPFIHPEIPNHAKSIVSAGDVDLDATDWCRKP